jgi:hypothetical protein
MTITNPEGHGTFFVSRVEIARGRLGRYQECNGLNILRDDLTLMPGPPWVPPPGVGRLIVEHAHRGRAARHKNPLLFRIRITDQYNKRQTVRVRLRKVHAGNG